MSNKLIPIPYCIFIIKPHVAVNEEKKNQIFDLLNTNEFDVVQTLQKKFSKQEIFNIFNKYKDSDFYQKIEEEMLSGESICLVLTNRNEVKFDEEKKEEIKVADPIERIKKLIGDKDPAAAKSDDPNLWRAIYGKDIVCNAFYSSDNAKDANREREIFHFPIPQKIPEFQYEKQKIIIEDLLKFVFPPNLEHSNSTGRLDLFALYGPIVNYHSVDKCFCYKCISYAKETLREAIEKALGNSSSTATATGTLALLKAGGKPAVKRKDPEVPIRLLQEEDMNSLQSNLCEECARHSREYTHLTGGRGLQHILSDNEISLMIQEINRRDLLAVLVAEKGSIGKSIMETLSLQEPEELMYKEHHIRALFVSLETDYYDRYEFSDMQK